MIIFHNGVIRNYIISVTEVYTGKIVVVTSPDKTAVIESLHPYYDYSCQVAAVTVNQGPFSVPVTITTEQAGI